MKNESVTPQWPKPKPDDLKTLVVRGKGWRLADDTWKECRRAWWRRIIDALTPWRIRTRLFWKRDG